MNGGKEFKMSNRREYVDFSAEDALEEIMDSDQELFANLSVLLKFCNWGVMRLQEKGYDIGIHQEGDYISKLDASKTEWL
jgi:hypothetical protein